MRLSKNLSHLIHKIFPILDYLYLLQLEEYYTVRYLKTVTRLYFKRDLQRRGKLVFTSRIQTTLIVSIAFHLFFTIFTGVFVGFIFSFLIATLLLPLMVGIANLV